MMHCNMAILAAIKEDEKLFFQPRVRLAKRKLLKRNVFDLAQYPL